MRSKLCLYYLLYYMVWVCFYLYAQQAEQIEWTVKKLMFYYPSAAIILFYLLIGQNGERYLAQFKNICLLSVFANFIIIIMNFHGLLNDPYKMMYSYCGLVFVIFGMILYSGTEHGTFNNTYENE